MNSTPPNAPTAGPVRALYVTADASRGERLEAVFEEERPAVAFSSVTSVERALGVVDAECIDHVVLDADLPDCEDAAVALVRETDPRVTTLSLSMPEHAPESADEHSHLSETERARVLATRIESAVVSETYVRDDAEGGESELRDRIRQQEALATFSRHALEDWSVGDLMNEAVELVADALDNEYAGVLEYRPDEDDLLVRAVFGWDDDLVGAASIGTERDSQAGYTLLSEEPIVVEDMANEDRFAGDVLLDSAEAVGGISAIIGSPENPWGILGSHSTDKRSYADYHVEFVQSIARILAAVLQRRERERRLERSEAMLDAVDDGVYALDADSRFVAVNDAYVELTGHAREELLGEHIEAVLGSDRYEESRWICEALDAEENSMAMETTMPSADGGSVPVEVRVAPLPLGDEIGRVGVVRNVSDRKRREQKLTSLNELFQSLTESDSPTEICDVAVEAAVETLDFPNVAVALYDDETSRLATTVQRWDGEIDDALLGRHGEDVAWQTFVASETRAFEDLDAALDADVEMGSALAVPLGKYGVFVAAAAETDAFDSADRSLADMLCSNVRTALDRGEREETLREQRNNLQAKNRELERVNRLNSVIRDITKALTQAASEDEAMRAVCERLTETGPYRFAWFGTHDRTTDRVRPETGAGVEDGYLEEIEVTADEGEAVGDGPAGRAVRSRTVQVQNDLLGHPPFDPWREQALERGYRSCVSIPASYDERLHGVLTIYADGTDVFDELERAVLSELGDTIGYALNALEQKQALVSERSIELDFRIRGSENPILGFIAESGAQFEFENAVQRDDGQLHTFFTISGADPEDVLAFAEGVMWIDRIRLVTERDDEALFECTLTDRAFLRSLMERGAMPRTITATEDGGRFVIRIPQRADVRTFVNHFEDYYENAKLVARRECDDPVVTRQDFELELRERLTERQREVLRMAYFGGYFEWPRESSAQEIADTLGVSQPTVSRHVRGAERALFGLLFEDE
ncbi:bacterio-opsin activator domain-containing protein [Halorussus pelagicus]|uniref:bacterio-opsin activator domain-containing protein n=1 Tax=Halorussus pelagicus TaxID=2505977 RepID=UPI000FFBBAF8|nr:bacterio-opsin activator domain-containing protein [Halorussus pelagicus]